MRERAYWRELLDALIEVRAERERMAQAIGVVDVTLSRWASGESSPKLRNALLLLRAVPDKYRDAFLTSMKENLPSLALHEQGPDEQVNHESGGHDDKWHIPFQLVHRILTTHATSFPYLASWAIVQQTLQHALLQLRASGCGLKITIFLCMPPKDNGMICSLREDISLGTAPWPEGMQKYARFMGAESLVGHTVVTTRFHQVPDLRVPPTFLPYSQQDEHEISAATSPIMRYGSVAGCVRFSSTQLGAFVGQEPSALLQAYTNLIALAYPDAHFYEVQRIQLQVMPPPHVQQPYLATFRTLVTALMRESVSTPFPVSREQAEKIAWQQIERLLLAHTMHDDLPSHNRERDFP